jgi:hypothetical protein
MAKRTAKNILPGLAGSPAKTAERIVRLLDESRAVTYMHTYEHFRRTLNIWLAALSQVKMGPWLEVCAGMERGLGPLQQALGLLMAEAMCSYEDVIGSVYMLLSQGEKRLGQYFTPYPVARLMAGINLSDLKPREKDAPPIRILEPYCGSGVMILACAEEIETQHPGMILRGDVLFYGVDLDSLCVIMCQINMLLHGIGHVERLPGAASGQANQAPRYVFQPARIVCGNSLTQDTAELFKQETPWIPVTLVLPRTAEMKEARATGDDGVAGVQGETEALQPSSNAEGAKEQRQMANVMAAQHVSVEEDSPVEAAPLESDQSDSEETEQTASEEERGEAVDLVQDALEELPQELDVPSLPALPLIAAATLSSEKKPEPDETVVEVEAKEEDMFSVHVGSLVLPHISLGQSDTRGRRRQKDDSDVVQQSLFS